ncbi:hypothetical protein MLD38_009177 [Melastoma candidum]|uniref:Uncharacterized protein n=1 Tax=Melastoma candidum TaxID=119954 RepID=A0ACB9RY06_9MYRT|nr:hypothetical protein MLD38_009177 [Melastoma candidum]
MKFTESPVIQLQVGPAVLSLHQDNSSMHVGTTVWQSSLVLVKFVERWSQTLITSSNPDGSSYRSVLDFGVGKRAIELGSGCGAAGMGLFLLGLTDILLTDISPVMPALKLNLKRNKPVLRNKALKASVLYWNNKEQIRASKPPFDYVIAADLVYLEDNVGHLVDAMEALVKSDGVVLLGYQLRCPLADAKFWEICEKVFDKEKVPKEHLHPEYTFEESDVYILRKKATEQGS